MLLSSGLEPTGRLSNVAKQVHLCESRDVWGACFTQKARQPSWCAAPPGPWVSPSQAVFQHNGTHTHTQCPAPPQPHPGGAPATCCTALPFSIQGLENVFLRQGHLWAANKAQLWNYSSALKKIHIIFIIKNNITMLQKK